MSFTALRDIKLRHVLGLYFILVMLFYAVYPLISSYHNVSKVARIERAVSMAPYSGVAPKNIMVMLHGGDMYPEDIMQIAEILSPHLPDTLFIAPAAVLRGAQPDTYKWYHTVWRTPSVTVVSDFCGATKALLALIARLHHTHNMPYQNIGVFGFSQGGTMALQVAMDSPEALWGAVSFAGFLFPPDSSAKILGVTLKISDIESPDDAALTPFPTPVMSFYGAQDYVIDYRQGEYAKKLLRGHGGDATVEIVSGVGHELAYISLRSAAGFFIERQSE